MQDKAVMLYHKVLFNKHLMPGPKRNIDFCFPETLNVNAFCLKCTKIEEKFKL